MEKYSFNFVLRELKFNLGLIEFEDYLLGDRMNIEQVNAALLLLLEASAILRQQEGEVQESAILITRGMSDLQRLVNVKKVQQHINDYRQSLL